MKKVFSILLLTSFVLAACTSGPISADEVAPREGAIAPPFSLQNIDGEVVNLADFAGQTVMLNFWATWCAPCRFEMPDIQDKFETTDLKVLAINFDESEDLIHPFVDELGLTFPILLDPGAEIQKLYQVRGYPTSVFINGDGIVQIMHIGFIDESQLDGYLQELGISN